MPPSSCPFILETLPAKGSQLRKQRFDPGSKKGSQLRKQRFDPDGKKGSAA